MKVKKVVDICKKTGCFAMGIDKDNQYLSDGMALYLLPAEIPLLTAETICTLYDIKESQQDKISFSRLSLSEAMIKDTYPEEEKISPMRIKITYDDAKLLLFQTSDGLVAIDEKYLKPIGIDTMELNFCYRQKKYIVVKKGLLFECGIVKKMLSQDFLDEINTICGLANMTILENKKID